MATQHSPLPWNFEHFETRKKGDEIFSAGALISTENDVRFVIADKITQMDAAFIVKCVNAHDELIGALKLAVVWLKHLDGTNPNTQKQIKVWETYLSKAEMKG